MNITPISTHRIANIDLLQFAVPTLNGVHYIPAQRAIADDRVTVTEVSVGGTVNTLNVINHSGEFLFFMDGDILRGAKQNRTLNASLIIGPHMECKLPVSCVEAGRWFAKSKKFAAHDFAAPSSLRAFKASSVTRRRRVSEDFQSDQGGIWDHIAKLQKKEGVQSKTGDLGDLHSAKIGKLMTLLADIKPAPGANGLCAVENGRIRSIDIFHNPNLLSDAFKRLLNGVFMEMPLDLAAKSEDEPQPIAPGNLADLVQRAIGEARIDEIAPKPSVGLGTEQRFETAQTTGFQLMHDQRLVHLAVLTLPA